MRASKPGTLVSGSGRSLISSPAKADVVKVFEFILADIRKVLPDLLALLAG
jgi:hypothetical protein